MWMCLFEKFCSVCTTSLDVQNKTRMSCNFAFFTIFLACFYIFSVTFWVFLRIFCAHNLLMKSFARARKSSFRMSVIVICFFSSQAMPSILFFTQLTYNLLGLLTMHQYVPLQDVLLTDLASVCWSSIQYFVQIWTSLGEKPTGRDCCTKMASLVP